MKNHSKKFFKIVLSIVIPLTILLFADLSPGNPKITIMASIALMMAMLWITELIPIPATSLIPLILFPILGIDTADQTAVSYVNSIIFLFIGGFLIALAMEEWGLHKRIALKIILVLGNNPSKIVLGFMAASSFLSMWISNTATALMMLPIGLAIIRQIEDQFGRDKARNFSLSILIGIAYGCSIGGIATLIGTPPNLSFARILHIIFPNAPEITFGFWLQLALPISIILFITAWLLLTKVFFKVDSFHSIDKSIIRDSYINLGKISFEEKTVLLIFISTALLWIFRADLNFGIVTIPGWFNLIPNSNYINDTTVAITMSLIMFFIPSKNKEKKYLLQEDVFRKIPWGIILLFGGGFALAKGFVASGLSEFIGLQFKSFGNISPILLMLIVGLVITFLTELTSNTATTEMILPIIASISVALGFNPMFIMINATFSASMAFMLPVATPPNAIIFGSGRINILDMAKVGLVLNLIGAVIITTSLILIGTLIIEGDVFTLPTWVITK